MRNQRAQWHFIIFIVVSIVTTLVLGLQYNKNSTPARAAVLNGPPPASGKQFTILSPGTALPSDAECANRVRRTTWEPRPSNGAKNQYVPTKGNDYNVPRYNGTDQGIWIGDHPAKANALVDRLSGNFTGTTDEIIQWAACKWGVDEDMARAQAVVESNWDMATNGDNGESFGILQVRITSHAGAFQGAQKSTAFNADYTYMRWRICFEGILDYLAQTGSYVAGDPWGCMGAWYTGNWYGSGGGGSASGAQAYINVVKGHLNTRTWEQWSGTQVSQTPLPNSTIAVCSARNRGDGDCNNVIDLIDFEIFRKELTGTLTTKTADFDNNGLVQIADFEIWRRNYFNNLTANGWWKPTSDKPIHWHWQLSETFSYPRDVKPGVTVYDIDGEDTSAQTVAQLHAMSPDIKVICYIDVGVFEDYRSDANKFPDSVKGNADVGWQGSWWLDIRQTQILLPIMEARIRDWCKAKGFDAVEPDESEVSNNNSGFPITQAQNIAYSKAIADLVHKYGMSVGLKGNNAEAASYESFSDWSLSEQCFEYNECDALYNNFAAKGKAVFIVEYNANPDCAWANSNHVNAARRDLNLMGPTNGSYRYTPCVPDNQNNW